MEWVLRVMFSLCFLQGWGAVMELGKRKIWDEGFELIDWREQREKKISQILIDKFQKGSISLQISRLQMDQEENFKGDVKFWH